MQIVLNFKRFTALQVAAAGLALVLAGEIGSAVAMSPIVQPPIKWVGGAQFIQTNFLGGPHNVYTVPAR